MRKNGRLVIGRCCVAFNGLRRHAEEEAWTWKRMWQAEPDTEEEDGREKEMEDGNE